MSLTLKVTSLFVRTLAKPMAVSLPTANQLDKCSQPP
jgi:hypothetical protein